MAFDLVVFDRQVYTTVTELVDQQVALFNEASGGAITLMPSSDNQGDFAMRASFKKIADLVRRRDVKNGANVVAPTRLQHLKDVSVKVASGTTPVAFEPAQYDWILQARELAVITIGTQLAEAMLQDMVNVAISGAVAAISTQPSLIHTTAGANLAFTDLVRGAGKFGDRQLSVAAWVMHSKNMTDLFENAVNNSERLFTYGTVNVLRDPFGRLFVMTDSPSLVTGNVYKALGLVSGGVMVDRNQDFNSNIETKNGFENIQRTYQAEWSYNLGLLGYAWNTGAGGAAPNNAAISTGANWEKTATSFKDTAGVLISNTAA